MASIGAYREEALMSGLGLLGETVWNGWIDVTDKVTTGEFENEPHLVVPYTDTAVLEINDVIHISITETVTPSEIDNTLIAVPYQGGPYFNPNPLHSHTWGEVAEFEWSADGIFDEDTEKYYAW